MGRRDAGAGRSIAEIPAEGRIGRNRGRGIEEDILIDAWVDRRKREARDHLVRGGGHAHRPRARCRLSDRVGDSEIDVIGSRPCEPVRDGDAGAGPAVSEIPVVARPAADIRGRGVEEHVLIDGGHRRRERERRRHLRQGARHRDRSRGR